jgi:UDP-N-acetylmuramoyl-L-alanyl-D-glutamate--2,6-diaminopimelate ligase
MVETGLTHAVSEVSSHALALKRVDYTDFKISVFTNLSRDHLDFHGDMESYYMAKERLFTELTREAAVVNMDDLHGERLLKRCRERGLRTLTYGFSPGSSVRATEVSHGRYGLRFLLHLDEETFRLQSPMIGITNLYNILAAVSVAGLLGLEKETIIEAVSTFRGVEGRMEVVDEGQDFTAVLDYAHTPDALEKVLQSLSGLTPGRLILVFGCGGNRDRGKRPEMGRVAERYSDIQIVTSDNPRDEPPEDIIRDILKGMKGKSAEVIPDRREAIHRAVEIAGKGDLILLAGKGHEEYQEIRGTKYPFSDREVLSTVLRERTGAGTAINGVPGEEGG